MEAIEYRVAYEADVPMLARLRYVFWLEDGHDPAAADRETFLGECEAFLRQGLISQQWVYWIAVLDSEIISQICVQLIAKIPKPSKIHDAFGYVTNVYTCSAYRRQGIGSKLFQQVQKWAVEQDLEFLILWPSATSVYFYERAGFTATEAVEYSVRPYIN